MTDIADFRRAALGLAALFATTHLALAQGTDTICEPVSDSHYTDCGSGRVVCGRTVTERTEVPWAASVQWRKGPDGYQPVCGATLINPEFEDGMLKAWSPNVTQAEWMISAAHCFVTVHKKPIFGESLRVVTGTLDLKQTSQANVDWIDRICIHEAYDGTTFGHDVAVVHLAKAHTDATRMFGHWHIEGNCYQFKPSGIKRTGDTSQAVGRGALRPMRLSDRDVFPTPLAPYSAVLAIGWGVTKAPKGATPCELQKLTMPVVDGATCRAAATKHGFQLSNDKFCAGYSDDFASDCKGDSGGGIVDVDTAALDEGHNLLVGVVSSGGDCTNAPGTYSTFPRMDLHYAWFRATLETMQKDLGL